MIFQKCMIFKGCGDSQKDTVDIITCSWGIRSPSPAPIKHSKIKASLNRGGLFAVSLLSFHCLRESRQPRGRCRGFNPAAFPPAEPALCSSFTACRPPSIHLPASVRATGSVLLPVRHFVYSNAKSRVTASGTFARLENPTPSYTLAMLPSQTRENNVVCLLYCHFQWTNSFTAYLHFSCYSSILQRY